MEREIIKTIIDKDLVDKYVIVRTDKNLGKSFISPFFGVLADIRASNLMLTNAIDNREYAALHLKSLCSLSEGHDSHLDIRREAAIADLMVSAYGKHRFVIPLPEVIKITKW